MAACLGLLAVVWVATGRSTGGPIPVARGELRMTVAVEGELVAVRAVHLGPPAVRLWGDFKIASLVPEGTRVKAGQPVVAFDPQLLARRLEQRQAELAEVSKKIEQKEVDVEVRGLELEKQRAQAEARLRKAHLKAEVPEELTARIEARKAELDVRSLEAEVESLTAELEALRATGAAEAETLRSQRDRLAGEVASLVRDMAAMTVVAPQDGIVIYKSDWNDEKPKVGDSVWQLQKVVTLPDLSEMKGAGIVDEADGGAVRVGQPAILRLDARPDLDLKAQLVAIGRSVQRKSRRVPAKGYRVELALDRTDPTVMRPAMRFRGEIEVARIADVLVVPRGAVFLRASGPVVWLSRPWGYEETAVRLGRRDKHHVEVLEGLAEGDEISPVDLEAQASLRRASREAL